MSADIVRLVNDDTAGERGPWAGSGRAQGEPGHHPYGVSAPVPPEPGPPYRDRAAPGSPAGPPSGPGHDTPPSGLDQYGLDVRPVSGGYPGHPVSGGYPGQPTSGGYPGQPGSGGYAGQPVSGGPPGQPV